jgi:hypothetical protein
VAKAKARFVMTATQLLRKRVQWEGFHWLSTPVGASTLRCEPLTSGPSDISRGLGLGPSLRC